MQLVQGRQEALPHTDHTLGMLNIAEGGASLNPDNASHGHSQFHDLHPHEYVSLACEAEDNTKIIRIVEHAGDTT